MNTDILDDFDDNEINNEKIIAQVLTISFISIVLFFLFEELRNYVPENLLDWNDVQINTIGLLIIGVYVINVNLLSKCLDNFKPKLSEIKITFSVGIIISSTALVFILLQSFYLGIDLGYFRLIRSFGIICFMGMLLANIRIHKIRNKKTIIPLLLLFGFWIFGGYMISIFLS